MARPKRDPAPCRHCRKEKKLVARGLCVNCYNILRNKGLLEELYPKGTKAHTPETGAGDPAQGRTLPDAPGTHTEITTHKHRKERVTVSITIQSDNADTLCSMIRDELDWILQRI